MSVALSVVYGKGEGKKKNTTKYIPAGIFLSVDAMIYFKFKLQLKFRNNNNNNNNYSYIDMNFHT
jgi:hypothetical protein